LCIMNGDNMAGVTTKTRKSPEGNPRAELAKALKAAKAAHGAVNKLKATVQKLFSEMLAAQNQIPALEKAVAKAEAAHIHAVAEAAILEKPAPASTVAEAQAAVVMARDRVNTLRSARQAVEAEIPEYEADAVDAETEIEKIISLIIADYVQVLLDG
jgi:chromosome segregation ATPase